MHASPGAGGSVSLSTSLPPTNTHMKSITMKMNKTSKTNLKKKKKKIRKVDPMYNISYPNVWDLCSNFSDISSFSVQIWPPISVWYQCLNPTTGAHNPRLLILYNKTQPPKLPQPWTQGIHQRQVSLCQGCKKTRTLIFCICAPVWHLFIIVSITLRMIGQ